jgi:uncharacterized protein YwqG
MRTLPPLPPILAPYEAQILATKKQTIQLHPAAAEPQHLWQSKIGGLPYLLTMDAYPKNPEGRPLIFLAQINCAEIPPLAPFPTKGLIQFFISDSDMYGLDFDAPTDPKGFRVLYHADVITDPAQLVDDFSFLPDFEENSPLSAPPAGVALAFSLDEEFLGPPDYHFDQVFNEAFLDGLGEDKDDAFDFFYELGSQASGAKMGGYAFFTQEDPRPVDSHYELLLQLDSDSEMGMIWGDMGIANFFILPEDLAACRFEKVWYNWDCA